MFGISTRSAGLLARGALAAWAACVVPAALGAAPDGAAEVVINAYLHCDDREDNAFEQTDEVYLIGAYSSPSGNGLIRSGPHDFRDGGGSERWRDFLRLASARLRPGETMSGWVAVMEDDGNSQAVIDGINGGIAAVPQGVPLVDAIRGIGSAASLLGKGGDDRIGGVRFAVTNSGGTLVFTAQPDGPDIAVEAPTDRATTDNSGAVTLHPFRMTHGCNYHFAIWQGGPKSNQ